MFVNNITMNMEVVKRDGSREPVLFDKITARIKNLCREDELKSIDPTLIAQKAISALYNGITTEELDNVSARICHALILVHPLYTVIGGRICASNLHKKTSESLLAVAMKLYNNVDKHGLHYPLVSKEYYNVIMDIGKQFESLIDYELDFNYDYFGFKTLERSYLLKVNGVIVERPQQLIMRVAVGIHGYDIESVKRTYEYMSQGLFTHATPTLFNAGTPKPQMSSCYLIGTEDSLQGIYKTISDCAQISKWAGGIGVHISNVRAGKSVIRGTNGLSDGIIPMLKVYNETARYVNQGGKRNGSIAAYLEPWHADVMEFLELKKNNGSETERTRDLFLALWIPDLFMKRLIRDFEELKYEANNNIKRAFKDVPDDCKWSLMCPDECPGLPDVYGAKFEEKYMQYEREKRYRRQVRAHEVWDKIMESQIETGVPYIGFKDHVNNKSNQQNIGTIKSSNLCIEIAQFSDHKETAVCNLASIAFNKFVENGVYNFDKLVEVTKQIVRNLNKIIDINYYPTPETKTSNLRHRPMGIGCQGLADVFIMMKLPFESDAARQLNRDIAETVYFAALTASCEIAKVDGPYPSYHENGGCPASHGVLQFDMWKVTPSNRWDWTGLKSNIKLFGLRNSLTTAYMPTASTSNILGNTECFEPITSNIYVKRTLAGKFLMVNRYLVDDLIKLKLWNTKMKDKIMYYGGSIQKIDEIPNNIKELYKTIFEVKQRAVIDHAADRGPFIDQSQSMNIYMDKPDSARLTSMLIYGWQRGLKTGSYYLRSKPATEAVKFGVDIDTSKELDMKDMKEAEELNIKNMKELSGQACPMRKKGVPIEDCEVCSS
ncbi:MAG: ribonucleoside-diphosphate reductase subunit alpha [Faunusvirus sp.]|jgi:ribonucleoside-diphosphate reductase alpha chain|uniref:Ribonucleoside-diphosphate reductase n=1 Tax=Faunusvirus sp. TaxID=2487766 RepID=A0A3G5A1G1_9VIRU|nr:MAG: ribonucleoside-diphosphate reductase subunit alpha [Faunusvirus sp.]